MNAPIMVGQASAMGVKISHKLSKARWRRRFRLRFSNIFHHEMFLF
jgi:hypothetical protein